MYPYICVFGFEIPTYGICFAIATVLCAFLGMKKAHKLGICIEDLLIVVAVSLGMSFIGSGLFYILVSYSVEEILYYIRENGFSFVFNGGIVFYGGLVFGIIGALFSAKILNVRVEDLEKSIVSYVPLGHAIGRIGCLLAGCCHGFEYSGFFAVENKLFSEGTTYFPVQFVEAILNVMIMLYLLNYSKKEHCKYEILCSYLIMYSIVRFLLEFFRGDMARGFLMLLSTSQWISVLIFVTCALIKIILHKKTISKTKSTS